LLKNDDDKKQWLGRYRTLQQDHTEVSASHQTRILCFEAELSNKENRKADLFSASLAISRKLADRPATETTLMQWAELDIAAENLTDAEDKCLHALFIRHQLGDAKNTLLILEKLQKVADWIAKLSANDLANWQQLFTDFDTYPISR